MDRHETVILIGETAATTQRKVLKIVRTDVGGFFGLAQSEGLPVDRFEGRFVELMLPRK